MRPGLLWPALVAALLALFVASFLIGRYPVPPGLLARILAARLLPIAVDWPATVQAVVLQVRLPRILAAMLVGGGLALSGACYQGVFRNPLVSPFILGVSAGAGFGAALAILWSPFSALVPVSAFGCSLLAVGLCLLLAGAGRPGSTLVLVLAGVVVGALFGALLALLKYVADPDSTLPLIEFWLLGSLSRAGLADVRLMALLMLPAAGLLLALRWRLNLLALGEDEARALGVDTARLRLLVVALATLLAATTVSAAGIVGWVGLVVPHAARILAGADFRRVLPAAALLGAAYLLAIDDIARAATSAELPLGVLTALVGAPAFALLLRRGRLGWA